MVTNPNQLFFTKTISNGFAHLDEVESRHMISVLRKEAGAEVFVTNGEGSFFKGILVEPHKKRAVIQIEETYPQTQDRTIELHIAIPPTKQNDRFEWFLEKATEVGVDRITPMNTKRTEKKKFRHDRAEKIVVSAMKQSAQAFLPQLDDFTSFKDVLKNVGPDVQKLIPYCDAENQPLLQDVLISEGKVCILIGPAGDFTQEEVDMAKESGFVAVSLGDSRLRSETAGVAVACAVKFLKKTS